MGNSMTAWALRCFACLLALALSGCQTLHVSGDLSSTTTVDEGGVTTQESLGVQLESSSSSDDPEYAIGEGYVLDVYETDAGTVADAVVEIKNTGKVPIVLGASAIEILDADGKVLVNEGGNGIFTAHSYLQPSDVGFVYTTGPLLLPTGSRPDADYMLSASADVSACSEVREYPISDLSIEDDGYGMPMVSGTVNNDDSESVRLVEISIAFLDNDAELLGVASTVVTNLAPGESRSFEIEGYGLPIGCTMAVIADYDVIAVSAKD